MARKNVRNELISNESARRLSFRKRKSGLLKKLKEFTILCGVIACAIIFSEYDAEPEIWPSPSEAFFVLEKFKNLPARKQGKYMLDQEMFLKDHISKLNMKLDKKRKKNQICEIELILAEAVEGKTSRDLNYFKNPNEKIDLVDQMIGFITNKIERAKMENKEN